MIHFPAKSLILFICPHSYSSKSSNALSEVSTFFFSFTKSWPFFATAFPVYSDMFFYITPDLRFHTGLIMWQNIHKPFRMVYLLLECMVFSNVISDPRTLIIQQTKAIFLYFQSCTWTFPEFIQGCVSVYKFYSKAVHVDYISCIVYMLTFWLRCFFPVVLCITDVLIYPKLNIFQYLEFAKILTFP